MKSGQAGRVRMDATQLSGVGDLLRRGQQAHERLWFEMVGSAITSAQYGVLLAVGRRPRSSQQQVSEEISIDKSTVGDVLHRLAARGLIELERDRVDRRRHVVLLTDEGRRAVIEASPAAMQVGDRFLRGLTFGEGERLLRLLREVAYQGVAPDPRQPPPPFEQWPLRLPVLRLDMTFGHLVRRAQRVHGALWRELAGQEVTPVQYDAMAVLAELGATDQGSWAVRSSLDPATATSLLSRLKRRELVEHTPHASDRRRKQLRLTPAGERVLERARGLAAGVERETLRPLPPPDQECFLALFREVCRLA